MSSYIDLHNLSEITMDSIDVSNLNCDSIITTDLTVSGNLTGLTTSTSSIFNYTYTPSTRTFTLGLANQSGVDYILITDSSGVFQAVLLPPLIYPLLSATSPILYNNTTGVFSLDTTIAQNETFTGLLTATNDTLSTISQANKVYVTPTSVNTNYFFPMFTSILAGYKDFVCESNTTFFYNPVTDQLTSSNFTGSSTIKTNSYQGLTTSSAITIANALNTVTVAGTLTASLGINIPTGQTYKINSVAQTFLNSLTATLPLLFDTGTNVVSISPTGNISVATIVTTGRSEFLNGNNTQGTNYSAYFGTSNSKSAQLVLFDGLAVNQYAQLYCRSNVFGIQGNISIISLEKPTTVTGSLTASNSLNSTTGTSNIVTPSSSAGSLIIGYSSISNGVIQIYSLSGSINNYGSFIQQSGGNLYIDNSGASSINIGTIGTSTTVNVYKLNITNTISYNSGSFHNYSKFSSTSFGHNGIVGLTVWSILSSPSVVFQTSITPRSSSSNIRINVNMTLSDWGTTAQNKHLSVTRTSSVGGFAVGVNATYDVIGATSVYGIHHILSGTTYDSVSFTFVDSTAVTAGTTYYYAVCARANSSTIPASPSAGSVLLGNSAYVDIFLEELF